VEVRSGHLRWVIVDGGPGSARPGDTRQGSRAAMAVVAKACRPTTFATSGGTKATMYDCVGRAAAIVRRGR